MYDYRKYWLCQVKMVVLNIGKCIAILSFKWIGPFELSVIDCVMPVFGRLWRQGRELVIDDLFRDPHHYEDSLKMRYLQLAFHGKHPR